MYGYAKREVPAVSKGETDEKALWGAIDKVLSLFPNHHGMEDALALLKIQRNRLKPRYL